MYLRYKRMAAKLNKLFLIENEYTKIQQGFLYATYNIKLRTFKTFTFSSI